jgi:mRNA-degrading endonuclease toxin of MazEF toxin-antitoxin module
MASVSKHWVPDRRDMIWVNFNPQVGSKMKDEHPMLVLSPKAFNERTQLVIGLPMTHAQSNETNPFAVKLALSKWIEKEDLGKTVHVYTLTNDVRVIKLLKPSKYSRAHKSTKRTFIKRCSLVPKGCMPNSLRYYDPCLSDTIIKKYPDVVGIVGIPLKDANELKRTLKTTSKKIKSFLKFAEDSVGVRGIPELVLHPLTKRPSSEIIVKDSDTLENNYKLLTKFDLNNEAKMIQFMDKHATYDPNTLFYTYTE